MKGFVMSDKKISPQDNSANQQNANKGTPGVNKQFAQAQGQMNPNQNQTKK